MERYAVRSRTTFSSTFGVSDMPKAFDIWHAVRCGADQDRARRRLLLCLGIPVFRRWAWAWAVFPFFSFPISRLDDDDVGVCQRNKDTVRDSARQQDGVASMPGTASQSRTARAVETLLGAGDNVSERQWIVGDRLPAPWAERQEERFGDPLSRAPGACSCLAVTARLLLVLGESLMTRD